MEPFLQDVWIGWVVREKIVRSFPLSNDRGGELSVFLDLLRNDVLNVADF